MKKISIKLSALALLLTTASVAFAQENQKEIEQLDEVVLSDTKFELKKENSGKVIYKITSKEIKQNTGKTVIDLLDNIAGVEVNGNNNASGSNVGLYFRGGRNRQVAVVIDGVLVTDPTGISSSYNLNLLDLNQVESIEILKGSSSTLYGSGAANGVINIKLKKASNTPISFNYMASVGTNDTQRNRKTNLDELNQSVGVRGTLDKFSYLANFSMSSVDGMSSANDKNAATPFEKDAFQSNNSMLKLSYQATEKLNFELFGDYNKYEYDYDGGAYFDSEINNGFENQLRVGFKSNFKYNKGEMIGTVSLSDVERGFDSYNGFSDSVDNYLYEGKSLFAEIINKYNFSENVHIITGVNYQDFDNQTTTPFGNIDNDLANYTTIDPFASVVYIRNKFNLNAGLRLNNHSEYGNHLVYHVNPSYNLKSSDDFKLKALASYSTAFIAPSTYQLFSVYGNTDLDPEENSTIEFGLETSYKKWLDASAVFFYREEDNAIVLPDFITYRNAAYTTNAKGVETVVSIKPIDKVTVTLAHTYTNKSADFDYIPKHKINANISVKPLERTFVSLNFKNVGERTYFDQYGSFGAAGENVVIDSYSLVDLSVNHHLGSHMVLFGSLNNMFNEDYEDTLGFSTKGRNFRVGLKLNF
ncbi:MAG: TonB-dependent receptor [Lutibacter sp.]|nr:MAG: TonB-dependent receptor [Lutibacter sp.]